MTQYLKDMNPENTPIEMVAEIRQRKEKEVIMLEGVCTWDVGIPQSEQAVDLRNMIIYAQTGLGITSTEFHKSSCDLLEVGCMRIGEPEQEKETILVYSTPSRPAPWMQKLDILQNAHSARYYFDRKHLPEDLPKLPYITALASVSYARAEVELEQAGVDHNRFDIPVEAARALLLRHGVVGLPSTV